MKTKEIVFLILFIVAGVFFYYAHEGKLNIEWGLDEFVFSGGEEFTFEESQVVEPPFPAKLKIINAHGKVEIQGMEDNKISITFQKKIWRKNKEQALAVSNKLKAQVTKDFSQILITTNREEFKRRNFETNFRITIPLNMDVEVSNSFGEVSAFRVKNASLNNRHGRVHAVEVGGILTIQNSYEDVEIENVQSDCQVESRHSKILANGVQGKLKITDSYGTIHLENISQKVVIESLHTEVFGQNLLAGAEVQNSYEKITLMDLGAVKLRGHHSDIEVDGARDYLDIRDSYGRIKLNNIQGNLYVDGKSLNVYGKKIAGNEIYIFSSYEKIELAEFSGKTTIQLSHGDLTLAPSPLTSPLEVKADYSSIKFFWPQGEKYPLEARTRNGNINWKPATGLFSKDENGETVVKAFWDLKDKPSVRLSTTYGDIRIEE
jgi:hypothetical protein